MSAKYHVNPDWVLKALEMRAVEARCALASRTALRILL